MGLETLKKRSEFLRIRGGARWATKTFVLETKPRTAKQSPAGQPLPDTDQAKPDRSHSLPDEGLALPDEGLARFGFTVTKRIGNAVVRNLIRRRLKDAVRSLADTHARPGYDYVLIARDGIVTCSFAQLTRDLKSAFERVHRRKTRQRR